MMLYTATLGLWAAVATASRLFKGKWCDVRVRLNSKLPETTLVKGKKGSKKGQRPIRFLIHAVSVGEAKAVAPLYDRLKAKYPDAFFTITSITQTGHAAAKRFLKEADLYAFSPIDFKRPVRRLLDVAQPDVIILSEGDLWLNFLSEAKKRGAAIFLASAKLSEKSFSRLKKFSFFTKKLLAPIDHIACQSKLYEQRFRDLGKDPSQISVTGNLKYDEPFYPQSDLKAKLGYKKSDRVIVIGSTHPAEEELILKQLKPLLDQDEKLHLIFVPRHPQRWDGVFDMLQQSGYSTSRYTAMDKTQKPGRLFLVDQMGLLCDLYTIADISIVAGSFTSKIGGHNIFEPLLAKSALVFGPHMYTQLPMREKALEAEAGIESDANRLGKDIGDLLADKKFRRDLVKRGEALIKDCQGSSQATLEALQSILEKKFKQVKTKNSSCALS